MAYNCRARAATQPCLRVPVVWAMRLVIAYWWMWRMTKRHSASSMASTAWTVSKGRFESHRRRRRCDALSCGATHAGQDSSSPLVELRDLFGLHAVASIVRGRDGEVEVEIDREGDQHSSGQQAISADALMAANSNESNDNWRARARSHRLQRRGSAVVADRWAGVVQTAAVQLLRGRENACAKSLCSQLTVRLQY